MAFVLSDNIISSLGFSTKENFDNILRGCSGIKQYNNSPYLDIPFCASLINEDKFSTYSENLGLDPSYARLERLMIISITEALLNTAVDLKSKRTLLVISTTKGNIDLLEARIESDKLYLWGLAQSLKNHFSLVNTPLVVSNACVSGVLAILVADRLIKREQYDNIIITGGDILSRFTLTGFSALKALSPNPCRPYDSHRDGINLGEAVGTIILSNENSTNIEIRGGASSNDANHISGPSRTGEGLCLAIQKTMKEANVNTDEIDYISAHGTATLYNDEMESKAFSHEKLSDVPLSSLKGYWGHTLGAAGIIESIAAIESMKTGNFIKNMGCTSLGVTEKINVIKNSKQGIIETVLKTASGFGGCNAAILLKKTASLDTIL